MNLKLFFSFLFIIQTSVTIFASEYEIYKQALKNLNRELTYLNGKYSKEYIKKIDKTTYSKDKYSKKLKSIYAGIKEAEKILLKKIRNTKTNPQKKYKHKIIVYIDAGHGGTDKGATSKNSIYINSKEETLKESDFTFKISSMVKKELTKKGYIVILSRDNISEGLSLPARSALCRAIKPDISVSVHLNSSIYAFPILHREDTAMPDLNYTKVFVWKPSTFDLFKPFYEDFHNRIKSSNSRGKSILLANNIAQSLKGTLNLDFNLSPEDDVKLAKVKSIRETLTRKKRHLPPVIPPKPSKIPPDLIEKNKNISQSYELDIKDYKGIQGKDLHMVREMPEIPSVLVEAVFISSPGEQFKLAFKDRSKKIAKAISEGIIKYFSQ